MSKSLQEVLSYIGQSSDHEIHEIMKAVQSRYSTRYPDWEVIYISCPRNDPKERDRTLEFLMKHFNGIAD